MREPYLDGNFWRDNTPGWGFRMYGGYPDGKGDLGFNTCDWDIRKKDKSPEAIQRNSACKQLLQDGVRWPNRMNQDIDSKNRLDNMRYRWPGKIKKWISDTWLKKKWFSKIKIWLDAKFLGDEEYDKLSLWLGKRISWKYRWQTGMTRDPYIAWAANCVRLGLRVLIEEVQPKWYNYRPNFWAWWNYLSTKEEKYLKQYRFWSKFSTSKKDYVSRLRELREMAIQGI